MASTDPTPQISSLSSYGALMRREGRERDTATVTMTLTITSTITITITITITVLLPSLSLLL